jgi:Ion channel
VETRSAEDRESAAGVEGKERKLIMSGAETEVPPLNSISEAFRKEWKLLGASIGLLAVAVASCFFLSVPWTWLGVLPVVLVDAYLLWLLFIAAERSDVEQGRLVAGVKYKEHHKAWVPVRMVGMIMVALFFLTIVFGFAALYQTADKGFCKSNEVVSTNAPTAAVISLGQLDAVYFSVVTAATVGYGDITPVRPLTKWLVMAEILSGILLLVGIVSFIISRIAGFGLRL